MIPTHSILSLNSFVEDTVNHDFHSKGIAFKIE